MKTFYVLLTLLIASFTSMAQVFELDFSSQVGTKFDDEIHTMSLDGNGKLIVGGDFENFNGSSAVGLVRLNQDGTIDNTFTAVSSFGFFGVSDLTVHSDNEITIMNGGNLQRYTTSGAEVTGASFTPVVPESAIVTNVRSENAGKGIIIGGVFSEKIARLNADGSLDETFESNVGTGFNGQVRTIEISNSGKIVVGGDFTSFDGTTRNRLAVLNADGTLDTSFDPGTTLSNDLNGVYAVAIQDDDKILAGSNPSGLTRVVRFNSDGTVDSGFQGTIANQASLVRSIYTNGTNDILVGGWFANGLVALDYNDGSYINVVPGSGIKGGNAEINAIAVQADGAINLGGDFTSYSSITVQNFARVATCAVAISVQPEAVSTCQVDEANFSVSATASSGNLSYQWQQSSNPTTNPFVDISDGVGSYGTYSGATTSLLNISEMGFDLDGYYYRCLVTDDNCTTTSEAVLLTLFLPQSIGNPDDVTACSGNQPAIFAPLSGPNGGFQWQEDPGTGEFTDLVESAIYQGVNSTTLIFPSVSTALSGNKYRLVSTFCEDSYTTESATLTVNATPEVASQPESYTLCESGDTSFSIGIVNSEPSTTIQWQYRNTSGIYEDVSDNDVYSGATTETLVITGADETLPEIFLVGGNGSSYAMYRALVTTNNCTTVGSANKQLEIYEVPTIESHPTDNTDHCDTGDGINTTFSVGVSNTNVDFQWQVDEGSGFEDIADNEVYSGTDFRILTLTGATSAQNGFEYRCRVGACATPVYSNSATFETSNQPTITQQPTLVNVCVGTDAEFEIVVTGESLTYQWQRQASGQGSFVDLSDNGTYSGTNNTILQISNPSQSMNFDRFRCVVTSGNCSVNSNTPNLRVYAAPNFTGTLSDQTVCGEESSAIFAKSAFGFNGQVHIYQWQEAMAGSDIFVDINDGEKYTINNHVLTVQNPTGNMNGNRYRLAIDGCSAEIISDDATLTVLTEPIFSQSPLPQTVCAGETTTFTASAIGEGVRYQWFRNDGSGYIAMTSLQTNPEYNIFNTPAEYDGNSFKCVASAPSPCHTVITSDSFEATLTVNEVEFSKQAESTSICWGETATFEVETTGNNITYQWLQNGVEITDNDIFKGTQSKSLTVSSVTSELGGKYYQCQISGMCEDNVSTAAYLTVNGGDKPVITVFGSIETDDLLLSTDYLVSGYDTFEWYLDGEVIQSFANNPSISPETAGSYTVIRESGGCISEASEPYNFTGIKATVTNVNTNENLNFITFPNPATHSLHIQFEQSLETSLKLMSLDGKVSFEIQGLHSNNIKLDVSHLYAGVYVLQVEQGENKYLRKVIIK